MAAEPPCSASGPFTPEQALDTPVLRELLSLLLEVRAHVEAHGAQLELVHALLERLDARVSTLQRLPRATRTTPGATSSAVRFEPAAAARPRALTLADLSADVLDKVVSFLGSDDELAASLACRKLRDAVRPPPTLSSAQQPQRPLKTRVRSLLVSLAKLQWGVAIAGAPLNGALSARVAGLCDLRMLSWLSARGCKDADGFPQLDERTCSDAARGGHLSVRYHCQLCQL
jgi:hypothetical protein